MLLDVNQFVHTADTKIISRKKKTKETCDVVRLSKEKL